MNNNNRGNNRRRGRGNNRPQGGGGGQQLNRIDSRARGNAPQLLEKYRKLAHDAHLNGDRVTAEYYLQFADHYFRVIADSRPRQDDTRPRPDRWSEPGEDGEESGEFSADTEFGGFDQPGYGRQRDDRSRDDRPRDDRPRGDRTRDDREPGERDEPVRRRRDPAEGRAAPVAEPAAELAVADPAAEDARSPYEPPENPFVREREQRGTRGLRPRREGRVRREDGGDTAPASTEAGGGGAEAPAPFDTSVLPPALGARESATSLADEDAPAPKRRGRKPKVAVDPGGIDDAA